MLMLSEIMFLEVHITASDSTISEIYLMDFTVFTVWNIFLFILAVSSSDDFDYECYYEFYCNYSY